MEDKKLNILIVGKGAKACALAHKLLQNFKVEKVYVTDTLLKSDIVNIDIREDDLQGLLKFALENNIDYTIPISSKALENDIVSFFQTNEQKIFGPEYKACRNILNKIYAKKLIHKNHIPTSRFGYFDRVQDAADFLSTVSFPVLIDVPKSDKFNGDKFLCSTTGLASEILSNLLNYRFEKEVLVQEYVYGHKFTIYFITDGYSAVPVASVADYSFAKDGDGGLLTSGCGCFVPDLKLDSEYIKLTQQYANRILQYLDNGGNTYVGFLGLKCTLTKHNEVYVDDLSAFAQNHDSASVWNVFEDDLIEIFKSCINQYFADEYSEFKTNDYVSIGAVVMSSKQGQIINGLELIERENISDTGISQTTEDEFYYTDKAEICTVTRMAKTLYKAREYLYEDLEQIKFPSILYRKDIAKFRCTSD